LASATNVAVIPDMITVLDYDDNTVLADLNAAMEYESARVTKPTQTHKRVLVPALAMNAYKSTGTTITYVQKKKQWVDMADAGLTEHYGIKGVLPYVNVNQSTQSWWIWVTYYFSCKQLR